MAYNTRELSAILSSDDELPDFYEEDVDIPAYRIDSRFEVATFPWIQTKTNPKVGALLNNNFSSTSSSSSSEDLTPPSIEVECLEKTLIKKGVLSKQDIFCLSCISNMFDTVTLLWFIDFLISKDMQSNYKFLTSCLVGDLVCQSDYISNSKINSSQPYTYEVIVKSKQTVNNSTDYLKIIG